ncbi:MAG: poly-gamma-glutamate synthase PgsB [Eubacteriales bacterium]|nr:poly-gamma-glutamate synthase PgsB [Eubacteriales bacterium]
MLYFSLLLAALYFAYLIYEKKTNDKCLSSFRYIIHVNGIRGKTGVCRLLDAAFREAGFRVFTKTTGSKPAYIDVSGTERAVFRTGPSNIKEQLRMIRRAHRQKAEVLILECMAVKPALQEYAQTHIVKGNFNVITNVRYDHIFEMGESLPEIAESLSSTIPENGILFTADPNFFPVFEAKCREKHSEAVLCTSSPGETLPETDAKAITALSARIPRDNLAIVLEAAKRAGISSAKALSGIKKYYQSDFGSGRYYRLENGTPFINLFSANDPQSSMLELEAAIQELSETDPKTELPPVFVYNHRLDRPDRLLLFIRHFFPMYPESRIIVIGEARGFACRLLKKAGFRNIVSLSDWQALFSFPASMLVGLGNIKGPASMLIDRLDKAGDRHKGNLS